MVPDGSGAATVLAFDNPWHITALIGLAVCLRLWGAYTRIFDLTPVPKAVRGTVLEFLDSALIALLLVFCVLRPFVIQAFYIPSSSMEPTLQIDDRILVNKLIYHFRAPQPGDIVVFRAPPAADHLNHDFIKRVVGAPGDRLQVKAYDGLYRNGKLIDEPYINGKPAYDWPSETDGQIVVPDDRIVVFGDNRNNSNDSHQWHALTADQVVEGRPFLKREDVLGKAMVIFYPVNRMRVIR